ncbi:MAG: tetratricopeptide repeat protein [Tepidisphaeraceae bacterium]
MSEVQSTQPPCKPWEKLIGILGLLGLALSIYGPILHGRFVADDELLISNNPIMKAHDGLYRFWFTTDAPDYFPLTSSVWWLEWHLCGEDTLIFHLNNFLLHTGSAILLWRIFRRLGMPLAWLAGAVFLVHPVNVESAAWISELKNTLSFFLCLCAAWCFIRFDERRSRFVYAISLVCFGAALLAKTSVVPFPAGMLMLAWYRRGRIESRDFLAVLPFFMIAATLAVVTLYFQSHRAIGGDVVRDDSLLSRLAIAGRAVWFYMCEAIFPRHLSFMYPRWPTGNVSVEAFLPLAALLALIVAIWLNRRQLGRGIVFGSFYYFLMLIPIVGLVNIYFMKFSLVSDHWQYPAIAGFIAVALLLIQRGLQWFLRGRGYLSAVCFVGMLILASLTLLARKQAGIYADPVALWSDTVRNNPASPYAHNNYGVALYESQQWRLADQEFRKTLELDPTHAEARISIGRIYVGLGKVDEGIEWFESAIPYLPDSPDPRVRARRAEPHYAMAVAYQQKGDLATAEKEYRIAIGFDPKMGPAHNNLALLLGQRNEPEEAEAEFRAAIAADPDALPPHLGLGLLLLQRGDAVGAADQFQQALAIDPTSALAQDGLSRARIGMNHTE